MSFCELHVKPYLKYLITNLLNDTYIVFNKKISVNYRLEMEKIRLGVPVERD